MTYSTRIVAYTALGITCALLLIRRLSRTRGVKGRSLPPRAASYEPFFNLDWLYRCHEDADQYLECHKQYTDTYRLSTIFDPMHTIVTGNAENAHTIWAGKDWGVGFRLRAMGMLLGRGFITMDGEEWFNARKMIKPSFNKNNVDDLGLLEKVVDEMFVNIQDGVQVDMEPLLFHAFMDTSLSFIFGIQAGKEDRDAEAPFSASEFLQTWRKGLLGMELRYLVGSLVTILPKGWHEQVCASIHSFVDFCIGQAEIKNASGTRKIKSMAEVCLLQTEDKKYVRNQLLHGMIASQKTTSVLMHNVVQLLSTRPSLWRRIKDEVEKCGDNLLTYDALRDNKLLQNVLLETLRFRPVFPALGRKAIRDTTLPTGGGPLGDAPILIPAGTTGIAVFYQLNQDTSVFGPNVDQFNPDRWNAIKPAAHEFMPFGAGGRICLGKEKVVVEAAYLLVRLAREFDKLESTDGGLFRGQHRVSMKNAYGCKVVFRK